MAEKHLSKLAVLKKFVLPKSVKVAIFVGLSAALTYIVNNVADLKLTAEQQGLILLVINIALAAIKEYKDKV